MIPIHHLLLIVLPVLLLSQCVMPVTAKNNGAKINLPYEWTVAYGETVEWTGDKTAKGFAMGKGMLYIYAVDGKKRFEMETACEAGKFHGPYVWRSFFHDRIYSEATGTFTKGIEVGEFVVRYFQADTPDSYVMKQGNKNGYGQLHGQCVQTTLDGGRNVQQWSNGYNVSETKYNPDGSVKQPVAVASSSSSSSYSDTDLIGGMFALGGLAGGDANVVMSGISMLAGDEVGAMQNLANMGSSGSVGSDGAVSGGLAGTAGVTAAPKRIVANKPDLIRDYGLARFRTADGDHIQFYIEKADRAYADYKRTGEEDYYTRHRECADIAKQFHVQTSTQGTRLIR